MFRKCDCGLLIPENYETCPSCVYGVPVRYAVRVYCRGCETIVGEYPAVSDDLLARDYVEKCDYCDPPEDARETDIVETFSVWTFSPDGPPNRFVVRRTGAEIRKQKADNEAFIAKINQLLEERELRIEEDVEVLYGRSWGMHL